jgi:hypothetical protein
VLAFVALGVLPSAAAALPTAAASVPTDGRINAGQSWSGSQGGFASPMGKFRLVVGYSAAWLDQYVWTGSPPKPVHQTVWQSALIGADDSLNSHLVMQTDGNLVLYSSTGHAVWSSHTIGTGSHNYLLVQDNGNLVVYSSPGHPVWASHSGPGMLGEGQPLLAGQYLRNIVPSNPETVLLMRTDGDLLLYFGRQLYWQSGTHVAGSHLMMRGTGDLAIDSPQGHTVWQTGTSAAAPFLMLGLGDVEVDGFRSTYVMLWARGSFNVK